MLTDILRRLQGELALIERGRKVERQRIAGLARTWGHSTFAQFLLEDQGQCKYPDCVGGQNGTHCHPSCTCRDCCGTGYDASGQTCGCQDNPSF